MRLKIGCYLSIIYFLGVATCNHESVDPDIPTVSFVSAGVTIDESSPAATNGIIMIPVVAVLSQPYSQEITIPLSIGGSATRDLDYTIPQEQLRFTPGSVRCTTSVSIIDDADIEENENVVLTMDVPGPVTGGALVNFTITIQSDDTLTVSFLTPGATIIEGAGSRGDTTINIITSLSHPSGTEVVVPLQIGGSGVRNKDYTIGKDTLHFVEGSVQCTTAVKIIDDAEVEPEKSLVLTMLLPGSLASGITTAFTLIILSDDKPRAGMVHNDRTVSRRSGSFTFGAYLDKAGIETISIPYTVSGSATAPTDHDLTDGVFVFNPGDTLLQKTVTLINDSTLSGFKNLIVHLEIPSNADSGDYLVDSITIAYDNIVAFQIMDNEIAAWQQSSFDSDYRVTEGEGLYTVINGGATPYIDCHYLIAQKQTLVNPAGQEIVLTTMRYATVADIDSIFSIKKSSLDTTSIASVVGYPQDTIIGNYSNSGVTHYIRFSKMYFELSLTLGGFTPTQIDSTAKTVVDWLHAKIQ